MNLRCAAALLAGLATSGVRRVVLSPGSRSTPLVLAAERHPGLTLDTVLDERSAGFYALGLARSSGRPVALIATSGSAPTHWYPAVVEAAQWGVPLVLLSADRPPQLCGWGANQTLDQTRLFGPLVREFHDPGTPQPQAEPMLQALGRRVAEVSLGPPAGPVHVNLPFVEPLVPAGDCDLPAGAVAAEAPPPIERRPSPDLTDRLAPWVSGRGLVVCGPDTYPPAFAPALRQLAEGLGLPVLADPLSGLRFGGAAACWVSHYDALLRHGGAAQALRPDWVLRFGRAPVSKVLNQWLAGLPTLLVDPAARWLDPEHSAREQVAADGALFCRWFCAQGLVDRDRAWSDAWQAAEARVARLADAHLAAAPWHEGQVLRHLLAECPAGIDLLVANSLPVRQLDTWSGTQARPLAVYGNRGASGIDGQIATLAGLNAGGRPTLGVIGDLAFWHDSGSLLLSEVLRAPLVVLNNGGGGIFGYLPQSGLAGFEQHWRTPVPRDIGAVVRGWGLSHRRAGTAEQFAAALADAFDTASPGVIEVLIDAKLSQASHQAYWQRVSTDTELDQLRG